MLINTYRSDVRMFIQGKTNVSSEGMTQGDPLAMSMYALVTLPLINYLAQSAISQWRLYNYTWYADDASAAGCLQALREWWDTLVCLMGIFQMPPKHGFSLNRISPKIRGPSFRILKSL